MFTHYKKQDAAFAATLPGWLVERGLKMAFAETDDTAIKDIRSVVKNIDKIRVLVSDNNISKIIPYRTVKSELQNDQYELFGMVNSKGTNLNFG